MPRPDAKTPKKGSSLKVVEKTLRVLELFTPERSEWTVTEISRDLGLPLATTHRILGTLVENGYLMRAEQARYRLGLAAIDLGRRAAASVDLRSALHPILRKLAAETGESVLLSTHDEARRGALTIDRVETSHTLRLSLEIGRVTSLHAGASSKAMLAHLEPAVRDEILAEPLAPLTPKTITDPARLRREMTAIRARGWAFSSEENDLGAWGISAPILVDDRLVAVLGVAAPTARYSSETRDRFARMVVDCAREAAAALDRRPVGSTDAGADESAAARA